MPIDKIVFQYSEDNIKVTKFGTVPSRGDYIVNNGKTYRIKIRIFDPKCCMVTLIMEEVIDYSDNN